MPREINSNEEAMQSALNQARHKNLAENIEQESGAESPEPLSFGKRAMQYWPIWLSAAFFDVLGLVPFLGIVANFCFGAIMFFYFGRKKVITGIIAPILIGSMIDLFMSLFLIGLWPTNLGAVFTRIMFKEITNSVSGVK